MFDPIPCHDCGRRVDVVGHRERPPQRSGCWTGAPMVSGGFQPILAAHSRPDGTPCDGGEERPKCPNCGGEHELCGPCPACDLVGIPITDGKLASHQWHRGRLVLDADPDEPGRWIGGCTNRDPGAVLARAAGG